MHEIIYYFNETGPPLTRAALPTPFTTEGIFNGIIQIKIVLLQSLLK